VQRGPSQDRLAHGAEVGRWYVGGLERQEENPTVDVLDGLAAMLQVPIAEFFRVPRKSSPDDKNCPLDISRLTAAWRTMPMAKDPMDDKYVQQFKKHLEQVDAFTLVVLKSHLIMESAIDNVIRLIFLHPNIIFDARMNFFQKVKIVRAYALREWPAPGSEDTDLSEAGSSLELHRA
jgi:transcriptional regulator with XRE-family HTH domain